MFIVATNIVASLPSKRSSTGTSTARVKKMGTMAVLGHSFLKAPSFLGAKRGELLSRKFNFLMKPFFSRYI